MDIGKYIGLYLVKNGYCSLPSLGTLQLEKKGAKKSSDGITIEPPTFVLTFNNIGSIDDKFPHFIAVNENISTNNASNAVSNFGKEVKEEVAQNRPYVIDGLGRFINNQGKVSFQPLSDLDLSEFKVEVPSTPLTTETTNAANNEGNGLDFKGVLDQAKPESKFSFAKVLVPLLLLSLIAIGGYFGYKYLSENKSNDSENNTALNIQDTTTTSIIDTSIIDTTLNKVDTSVTKTIIDSAKPINATPPAVPNGPAIKVAIFNYNNLASAEAKSKKLNSFGNNTMVQKIDSANFQVVISLPVTSKPTDLVVDSLRKFFNPKGKVEVVK